jgi:hypothetical protein
MDRAPPGRKRNKLNFLRARIQLFANFHSILLNGSIDELFLRINMWKSSQEIKIVQCFSRPRFHQGCYGKMELMEIFCAEWRGKHTE